MASWSLMLILLTLLSHQEAEAAQNTRLLGHKANYLRVYTLPIGQGSAHIIQCPTGELTIYDMGSTAPSKGSHWGSPEIVRFLDGKFHLIKNIVISHTHIDHINLLHRTFGGRSDMTGLENVYVPCHQRTFLGASNALNNWIRTIRPKSVFRGINRGKHCNNMSRPKCEGINLCPQMKKRNLARLNAQFIGEVIFANKDCRRTPAGKAGNRQSVMMKIKHTSPNRPVTILLPGDMEPNQNDGFTDTVLGSTAYVLSHHGGNSGNPPWFMDMIKPKVIFVSGDPHRSYGHPYCDVLNHFTTLCATGRKRGQRCSRDTISAPGYACTTKPSKSKRVLSYVDNNSKAIYSTIYNNTKRHLLIFETDGTNWNSEYKEVGVKNN